ncbi:MAG: transporter permease [Rhizobacter sp.]|nr:transporter permease [Rhizobacter sp.]
MRVVGRVIGLLPILVGAVVFTVLLTRWLPGDPAAFLASGNATPQEIAALRASLGLDAPWPLQLWRYAAAIVHGDWGVSHVTGQPVWAELKARLPASAELTLSGFVLTVLVAVPLGVAAAFRPRGVASRLALLLSTLGACLPAFVVGLLLLQVFYVQLGWAPEPIGRLDVFDAAPPVVTGMATIDAALAGSGGALRSAMSHLVLPSVSMALFGLSPLLRATRAAMLAALSSDAVRTARSLGLPPSTVFRHYTLRLALLPIVTTGGLVFSYMLGANVVVEKVFAWPGIGSYALDALMSADHAPLQGFVLLVAAMFAVVNVTVDLLAGVIDARTGST